MVLACNICEKKGVYRLKINCGRFDDIIYFCKIHKPLDFELMKMNEKQTSDGKIIKREILEVGKCVKTKEEGTNAQ